MQNSESVEDRAKALEDAAYRFASSRTISTTREAAQMLTDFTTKLLAERDKEHNELRTRVLELVARTELHLSPKERDKQTVETFVREVDARMVYCTQLADDQWRKTMQSVLKEMEGDV